MPILEVHLLEGRSRAVKAELVQGLTEVVQRTLGSRAERISVLITEYPDGNWNVGGEPLRIGTAVQDD